MYVDIHAVYCFEIVLISEIFVIKFFIVLG